MSFGTLTLFVAVVGSFPNSKEKKAMLVKEAPGLGISPATVAAHFCVQIYRHGRHCLDSRAGNGSFENEEVGPELIRERPL